jgi:aspartyl/asparaginyl beta-hydroxylase (cupin superfamily)/Tfp pilus assembly protein PilF
MKGGLCARLFCISATHRFEARVKVSEAEVAALLRSAAQAQGSGRTDLVRQHLQAVLKLAPDHPGALNSLGMQALAAGELAEAEAFFGRAAQADPEAPPLWLNLAKAQRLRGDAAGERISLTRVLEIDQRNLTALIRLAELHERLGEQKLAAQRWTIVLHIGRAMEQRPAELDTLLDHAARYVAEAGRSFGDQLESALGEAREALSSSERRRFDACIDHVLGRRQIYRNECAGLHFPFLPADEFFDRGHFPWLPEIEAKTDVIRAELEAILAEDDPGILPYVSMEPGTPSNKWSALDRSLAWGALHLWKDGRRDDKACARAPKTAAAVEALPLSDLPGRTPTIFFSLLRPGTHLPAHTGVSNVRTIIHLPLIVPEGCGFRVGGETREWRVGEAFAFDDTIEHEAWNRSDKLRAILIFDVWNPYITEPERELLRKFFVVANATDHSGDAAVSVG